MIEITEDKFEGLCENVEKMLKYGGKAMSCIEEMKHESQDRYSERNPMPDYRGRWRHGYREGEDYEERERRERSERDMPDYRGGGYRGGGGY